ncbi:hypothetical protein [Legionella quateirensis]|uniref:Ras-GEF domain-containing protein n=1 Tax=Legionella quateirensis TaxID=45072 RepID=A0A378L0R7_9GAMM|nr:hypothetical protein [Legionella quateirensis]KTD51073.1 hypothetical protein Lqua_1300 [Legionella quateirensis]STY17680.1 Uncharacterised protein [Legionella quateirensis]
MRSNKFRDWLNQMGNQQFVFNPICSEQLDRVLTDKSIQKSIARSKKNQLLYSYVESKIVSDYASIIDCKLRDVFYTLSLDDFKDPKGFECKDKSSSNQYSYFDIRNKLEFFLKQDIQQHHDQPDAKLNAFRRWIGISDVLLRRHCYEGFLLVFTNLQLIASPNLIKGLPQGIQNTYHELCQLNSPHKNHLALRNFIKNNSNETNFSPLIFTYHAIAVINESILHIREQDIVLKSRKKEVRREIHRLQHEMDSSDFKKLHKLVENREHIPRDLKYGNRYMISLLREFKRIPKALQNNQKILCEQKEQRTDLINTIAKEQSFKGKTLPAYLEKTFNRISFRYNKQNLERNLGIVTKEPVSHRDTAPSRLYSHSLRPSFWNRKGKSAEQHWNETFTPSCLHSR